MTSDFETGLLARLKSLIDDIQPEQTIEGKGKQWLANLYSIERGVVIEASSRNIRRTGRNNQSVQHVEKFQSMLLKLIDIRAKHPNIKPVMVWQNQIPATSNDLKLASEWGVYVLSNEELRLKEVLDDVTRRRQQVLSEVPHEARSGREDALALAPGRGETYSR